MLEILLGRALPWLFVGLGYWLLYQLVRQNGRILLTLEAMERQLGRPSPRLRPRRGCRPGRPPPSSSCRTSPVSDGRWRSSGAGGCS